MNTITDKKYPHIIYPDSPDASLFSDISYKEISKHGAVLFRGFNIDTIERFQQFVQIFPQNEMSYHFRSSPRKELSTSIYESTSYPEDEVIHMHSENTYSNTVISVIMFCCIEPAESGGETPISDNKLMMEGLPPALVEKFEKGVLYKRNINKMYGLGWEEVFQTSHREEVEEYCKENNIDFEWKKDNSLTLSWKKDAFTIHPLTKEKIWFNHSYFFNKYRLPEGVLEAFSEEDIPNDTFFGDGEEISEDEIMELYSAYNNSKAEFLWEKGDLLILDNILFSHGRNTFTGNRKIVTSFF